MDINPQTNTLSTHRKAALQAFDCFFRKEENNHWLKLRTDMQASQL